MSEAIRQLEPSAVWNRFADLNAVPRPSKKEGKVIQFMLDFGEKLGLDTFKDKVGNVIIRKPATLGMEDRKTVTIQSHLDMVHQKNSGTNFDFEKEGIRMLISEDWVIAEGTTLGADNGLGVAAIMAILESDSIPHPPVEALFTIDEETGMTGAMGLEAGVLQGQILLNLDTEEDDEIDIGCAGGLDVTANGVYKKHAVMDNARAYNISVKGLNGGHSGMDIHRGLGNANKIMNRILFEATTSFGIQLAEIDGGGLRNAIPRESFATLVVSSDKEQDFKIAMEQWINTLKVEFAEVDPALEITITPTELPGKVMDPEDQQRILRAIYAAWNGVYTMSTSIAGLVESSNNIARVLVGDGKITISCLTRSSVESSKADLANTLKAVFELAGYAVKFSGSYPGWRPNPDSEILKVLSSQYKTLFQEEPRVVACHAGLECGILGQHYPEMDMISIGPTIEGAHSPDERLSIPSVQKFWKFLKAVLENTPKNQD
ncbi:aminoacyl-histidine dipeptidase [Poritiphilus flavus]|uniref:Cytosol non-specific dipeptidase n=1 Tax=Poritiphilus flavus TaxID=2697053 RepID=A0A6L9E9R0_9FLAO|nr:aminoacyl-histidine dipeptidase [Poritiphilus flavus]NAS11383.1 beta-Ala-His dipeptidase [Poritiphilus flavus]